MLSADVRRDLERLAAISRASATEGEAEAGRLLSEMLRERDLDPVLEQETAVGGYWQSTGLAAGAATLAGVLGARSPRAGSLAAAAAAALMADDVDNGAHLLRRALPHHPTANVLAWAGDRHAPETVVVVAHHDAAHTGLLFHPGLVPLVNRIAPGWYAKQRTSTHTGRLLTLGPLLVAVASALGLRRLRWFGALWGAATAALLADVARSPVVAGANDNLSAVAVLLAMAEQIAREPVTGVRLLLLSTGSEESFMEGMRGFMRRHRAELDPARTRFLAVECVGSPHLILIEGEGMLRMRDYDASLRDELQAAADEAEVPLWRGLRLGAGGTDALPALRSGYRAACIAACTDLKVPANYHWKSDVPENLCWQTIEQATLLAMRFVRRVGEAQAAGKA